MQNDFPHMNFLFEVRNQMSMVQPIEFIVRESCGARLELGEQP
jgi:hypothetical protein